MTDGAPICLPGGLWLDGHCHREVRLRPLTGRDQEQWLGDGGIRSRAEQVSGLLAGCIERLGPIEAVTPALAGRLTVGDREALLLHLRRLTMGSRLLCVARCPTCGSTVDLELFVGDLLHAPYPDWRSDYETQCATPSGGELHVRYRLPTGDDQMAVAAAASAGAAESLLLRRCLITLRVAADRSDEADADVEMTLLEVLPALMAERDPQAESLLEFVCPECRVGSQVLLDAADFLFRELGAPGDDLYRQVHRLARHYHWSEAEILALPWSKRQRYLGFLAEGIA